MVVFVSFSPVKTELNELYSFVFKWRLGSWPLVCLGVMQYGDQLVPCRWGIIGHTLSKPENIFSQQQDACRCLTHGLTLTRFIHSKQTAHCTPIPGSAGEEEKKKHTSWILGTWWGWCPSLRLFSWVSVTYSSSPFLSSLSAKAGWTVPSPWVLDNYISEAGFRGWGRLKYTLYIIQYKTGDSNPSSCHCPDLIIFSHQSFSSLFLLPLHGSM